MSKKDNDALRRKKNGNFIRAFNYVATARNMNQGELATAIGSKSAYISGYKSGIRPVTDEVIEGLIRESCVEPSQQIYREYLLGNSEIMLLANVTDEELAEVELRRNNPDYDTMQQRNRASERGYDDSYSTTDPSSIMNAALAAQMQAIELMKSEKYTLLDVHAREIASLNQQIADKQTIIDLQSEKIKSQADEIVRLQKVITDLRSMSLSSDIEEYISNNPFPIGVADKPETPRAQV